MAAVAVAVVRATRRLAGMTAALFDARDVRGFVEESPELDPARRGEPPQPYLGADRVKAYVENVRAFIAMLRYTVAA